MKPQKGAKGTKNEIEMQYYQEIISKTNLKFDFLRNHQD